MYPTWILFSRNNEGNGTQTTKKSYDVPTIIKFEEV